MILRAAFAASLQAGAAVSAIQSPVILTSFFHGCTEAGSAAGRQFHIVHIEFLHAGIHFIILLALRASFSFSAGACLLLTPVYTERKEKPAVKNRLLVSQNLYLPAERSAHLLRGQAGNMNPGPPRTLIPVRQMRQSCRTPAPGKTHSVVESAG